MADVGVQGCGFEQPFEALHLTYSATHMENEGFFREDAYLAVVFVSDEDDCSAENVNIFDPQADETTFGPLTSFRCTEFGISCAEEWDRDFTDPQMEMTQCISRPESDMERGLYPISRYTDSLVNFKGHPAIISLAAIIGPSDGTMTIERDANNNPRLMHSCTDSSGNNGAVPGVRFNDLVTYFALPADREWALYSVCETDYSPALEGIARNAATAMMASSGQ